MTRSVVAVCASLLALVVLASSAGAQNESPLLGDPFNCPSQQSDFGGAPQPAVAGETTEVDLRTDCFVVVAIDMVGGADVQLTYLSGQFDSLNIAFYQEGARPGQAFHDPPNPTVGTVSASGRVPGGEPSTVLVAIQAQGGPGAGTASVRIGTAAAAAPTTTAPATTATSAATAAPVSTGESTTTAAESTTVAASNDPDADPTAPADSSEPASAADDSGGLPWWLLAALVLGALGWFAVLAVRSRRHAPVTPWERSVLTWTLQHSPPTGSCSSSARALVDPDDDGRFNGYSVSALFALPRTGKRVRTTVGDPLLAQLDTLWANEGSGAELRSAVDAFVNSLCRHLDAKKVSPDSTLLTELTKPDVVVHGEVHACVDGHWHMFEGWRDVPDLPEGQIQHDVVQVAVLGVGHAADRWTDRADELARAISALIETRRAPAGLWVFD